MFNGQFLNGVDCFRIFNFFEKSYPEYFKEGYFVKIQQMFSNTGNDPPENNPNYIGTFPPFTGISDTSSRVWFRFEFNIFKGTKNENDGTYTWEKIARKSVYYARLFNIKNAKNWSINTGDLPMEDETPHPQEVG